MGKLHLYLHFLILMMLVGIWFWCIFKNIKKTYVHIVCDLSSVTITSALLLVLHWILGSTLFCCRFT